MIRTATCLAAAFFVAGCNSSGTMASGGSRGAEIKRQIDATTLPSGWRVDCLRDEYKAQTRCFAGTFAKTGVGAFQVSFINGVGPEIIVPHDFPGRVATVRVDGGPVNPTTSPQAIVEAMKTGQTAFVVFHVWPTGEQRATVDVSGFREAYPVLLQKVAAPTG